jgi:hypothetical protein
MSFSGVYLLLPLSLSSTRFSTAGRVKVEQTGPDIHIYFSASVGLAAVSKIRVAIALEAAAWFGCFAVSAPTVIAFSQAEL